MDEGDAASCLHLGLRPDGQKSVRLRGLEVNGFQVVVLYFFLSGLHVILF